MSGSRRYIARLEGIPLWVMPLPVLAVALFVGVFQQYGVAGGRADVPGYYPTRYGVRYDPTTHEYSVALEGLMRR